MKRLLLPIISILMLSGCVETLEERAVTSPREITFQTANRPATRASGQAYNGTKFEYDHFMTCAWSEAAVTDDKVLMNHEKVTSTNNEWKTVNVYYWPTYSTVDFISYYPESSKDKLTVSETQLKYTGYDVSGDKEAIDTKANDLMYADKAVGYGANADDVNDDNGGINDSGYEGVPTLFNHALAQLEIRVLVQQPVGETANYWEAVINEAALKGYYTKGDLTLTLDQPGETPCVVGWTPSKGTEDEMTDDEKKVGWINDGDAKEKTIQAAADGEDFTVLSTTDYGIKEGEETVTGCKTLYKAFVLPQMLGDSHILDLKLTINQYNADNTKLTSEADTEVRHLALNTGNITLWGMNQRIVYTIVINPAKKGRILFDPAIKLWEDVKQDKDADDVIKYYIPIPDDTQWEKSNVWHAYNEEGQQVAEMSKELIRDSEKNYYQAVIINPVIEGKTDLKNGFIAQVLQSSKGNADNLAGGSVCYVSGSEINYTNRGGLRENTKLGNHANYSYCMIEKGKVIGVTDIKGMAQYEAKEYTVTDNEIDKNVYPVVRCGATYWLRENLRATHYTNGVAIDDAATTTVSETDKTNDYNANLTHTRIFHDKAAYRTPASGSDTDIKKYGLLYNFRAISCADEYGDYWLHTPYDNLSALAQKGTPNVKDEEANPTICPVGWYIPHVRIQYWDNHYMDIDYLDSYLTSMEWQYLLSEEQPFLTSKPSTNNWSGFSLNLCPAGCQADGTFGLATSYYYPNPYCIPFWTANLEFYNDMCYPAPGVLLEDNNGDIWYQYTTNNYDDSYPDAERFLERIGKAYYPVRCVRIEQ